VIDVLEIAKDAARARAHGGAGWSPRMTSLRDELGKIWRVCGVESEWSPLKAVLMHRPGPEIETITDANSTLMLDVPNAVLTRHRCLQKETL